MTCTTSRAAAPSGRCGTRAADGRAALSPGACEGATDHDQEHEKPAREDEGTTSRDGQGGHAESLAANLLQRVSRVRADYVPIAAQAGAPAPHASDDEVDELARHDDRLPGLTAVQMHLHAF